MGYGVVYGHDFKDTVKAALPREASIFTAELSAILKALTIIRNSIPLSWTVFSDSQAALQAYDSERIMLAAQGQGLTPRASLHIFDWSIEPICSFCLNDSESSPIFSRSVKQGE